MAAQMDEYEWARIALSEAFARDFAAASKRAASDEDLSSVRHQWWFNTLMKIENCDESSKSRYCMNQWLQGEFVLSELTFDRPLALRVAIPEPPKPGTRRPFVLASDVTVEAVELASAKPVAAQAESEEATVGPAPHYMYFDTGADFRTPLFWWPGNEGDPAFLLIPHQSEGVETFTIATKTAKGWMATTLDTAALLGDTKFPVYGLLGVRRDYREIFTLAWTGKSRHEGPWSAQQLCRIRWEDGALRRGCAPQWEDNSP